MLETYEDEQRSIAHKLINFDHRLTTAYEEKGSFEDLIVLYETKRLFSHGVSMFYTQSCVMASSERTSASTADSATTSLQRNNHTKGHSSSANHVESISKTASTSNIRVGYRFPDHLVLNQFSNNPVHIQSALRADRKWRLIIFASDLSSSSTTSNVACFHTLSEYLSSALAPYMHQIRVLTIYCGYRHGFEAARCYRPFFPLDEHKGYDYETVFVDNELPHVQGTGGGYEAFGIEKAGSGRVVMVHPDGHVAWMGTVAEVRGLTSFLGRFCAIHGSVKQKKRLEKLRLYMQVPAMSWNKERAFDMDCRVGRDHRSRDIPR